MAAITRLSLSATPGRRYSFVAKGWTPKGVGIITSLSVTGTPGKIHSFIKKGIVSTPKGEGAFTYLSLMATPGMRKSFVAKGAEAAVVDKWADHDEGGWVNPMEYQEGLFAAEEYQRMLVLKDDDEVLSIIANIITSGIL